jgi:hypothetical protein
MIFTMTKNLLIIALFLLCVSCSSRPASQQESPDQSSGDLKLTLNASPRQGFAPLHVSFQANFTGAGTNDHKYYCLQEEWDFGDGAKSTEKPNCDPYGPDTKIKTEFFVDHTYEKEGSYTIRFSLGEEGKDQIHSRQVSVLVLERSLNPGK